MRDELVRGGATIDLIAALMMGELDREHETTPAHWARVALKAFNRKLCEAVAEYLEGLMNT